MKKAKSVITKRRHFILKKVGKAIADYNMVQNNDRILVAVSGGKDSFSLLAILRDRLAFVPIQYELIAAHISSDEENAAVVERYLKENEYKFHIEKLKTDGSQKVNRPNISPCFWCSWKRREALFKLAAKLNCNKIALAHHKDDIIQTQLLNLCFQGEISTMVPVQKMFNGRFSIIRPLAYVEESELKRFARDSKFPTLPHRCPQSKLTKRRLMKKFIDELEKVCPNVKSNIFHSSKRIKKDYLPYIVMSETVGKSTMIKKRERYR